MDEQNWKSLKTHECLFVKIGRKTALLRINNTHEKDYAEANSWSRVGMKHETRGGVLLAVRGFQFGFTTSVLNSVSPCT